MSTYLSSLLTTTQRFRQLLPAGESDGDTTDDTHICRVLRAYYTEKGRAFPNWLPPDPKSAPPAHLPQNSYGNVGAGYGQMGGGGGNKLGSLWDLPGKEQVPQQPTQSLRQNRQPVGGGSASLRAGGLGRREVGGGSDGAYAPRPLPSQRDGSYQNPAPPLQQVSSAGSAQDRLKNRLFGGKSGSTSPAPGATGSSGLRPPGGDRRQESYESGKQDRLDTGRPSANQPWAGDGDPYAQDPRRQGGQRGYR